MEFKFKLNSSPHLRMHEITKQLFNNKFLSDVQFSIDGKIIYAHSLELMKRSVVFEQQLKKTCGEEKLIPITNCTYGSFLEFVRFIYTDECNVNDENGIELLKVATKYQVIMLENYVINSLFSPDFIIQLFEYCVVEKYDIARNYANCLFAENFYNRLSNSQFLSFHPDAVNEVLQFEAVANGVTEKQISKALADWINNYCKIKKISLSEGRQQFDNLIRKVRFPAMSIDEIRKYDEQYPELLCESDISSIARQIVFGDTRVNNLWISKARDVYEYPFGWKTFNRDVVFETHFSVSKETYLNGIWIGREWDEKEIEIIISAKDVKQNKNEKISFTLPTTKRFRMLINLGHSLQLTPNYEYTIVVKYLELTNENVKVFCRNENVDLMYNNPDNSIQIIKASDTMLEMYFKAPAE